MNDWLLGVVVALSLLAAAVVAVQAARDTEPQDRTFLLLAVIEAVLVVQVIAGSIALARTDRDVDGVTFVSYLVAVALVLPIGAFLSLAERSRWGTILLGVAVVTVLALEVRMDQIWSGVGA
ncbi:hypothetical protein [Nocardioides sp. R-C-SC26]|uniref:hypothetical protein n=1 Tax=Nocardioides sp. R-C-SC26 TaxID=2870414 RepID=UPI001E5BF55C|nr:hypothetical protein [Nocardioides sp. R-C-SC26]